ncbi:MAG: hypothetical protein ACRDZX_16410 [Acidimicrobiales bacterium]
MAGGLLAGLSALALAACGGPSASSKLTLSPTSGPSGTVVDISGDAGPGCSPGHNWFGFNFGPYGAPAKGPATGMTPSALKNGSWTVRFLVPPYLGGQSKHGLGAAATPGRYQFVAPACRGHTVAKASFRVTAGPSKATGGRYVAITATRDGQGYWLVQADGRVSAFGDARSYGSLAGAAGPAASVVGPAASVVGMARTYDGHGYWLVSADGHVHSFGDARPYGSLSGAAPGRAPVTGIAATPDGRGYWVLAANGHVYRFGDARLMGMPNGQLAPYDAVVARPAGGYVITAASDGAVYLYPGGVLSSGGPGASLSATLVGTAVTPSGNGTWQAGLDGGVVTSGDAGFYGSLPGENVVAKIPVTAIAASPDGHGYWLVNAKGHVYPFGDAHTFPPASA